MGATPPASPTSDSADRSRQRRQRRVVGGVLLTFAGLLFASLLLPTSPGALLSALPIAGLALLVVWVGGILLGSARGMGSRGR